MALDPLAPDLSGLAALARDGRLDVRPILLRVHTDLFLTAPSRTPEMLRSFAALASGLIPVVDADTAVIVARKLAPSPDTPAAVIEALLARGDEVTDVTLTLSPHMGRAQLDELAERGARSLALAVADRCDLDNALVEHLLARDDAAVDERIARNVSVVLTPGAIDTLLGRARYNADLAARLVERRDLGGVDKAALYRHASETQRVDILRDVARVVALSGAPRGVAYASDASAARLLDHALKADKTPFLEALAELLGAEPGEAWRLDDPSGELIAFGLIAAGVTEEDAIRMFLRLDAAIARSVQRVFHLAGLIRSVPRPVAERIIQLTSDRRVAPAREQHVHVPAMAASGTFVRRGPTAYSELGEEAVRASGTTAG